MLGIDSNNPPVPGTEDFVNKEDEILQKDVKDALNYRYKVICNVSRICACMIIPWL